jgi:hypothetical protein
VIALSNGMGEYVKGTVLKYVHQPALAAPPGTMMEAPPLVYMKLKSPRRKDQMDVIEMIKGGIDARQCREYLAAHAPAFVDAFDESVTAEAEQD